jgi:hypothetical protein
LKQIRADKRARREQDKVTLVSDTTNKKIVFFRAIFFALFTTPLHVSRELSLPFFASRVPSFPVNPRPSRDKKKPLA